MNNDDEPNVEVKRKPSFQDNVSDDPHKESLAQEPPAEGSSSLSNSSVPAEAADSAGESGTAVADDNDNDEAAADKIEVSLLVDTSFEGTPGPPPPENTSSAPSGTQLAEYNCPICFTPPSNATLTPCGHVCCGSCLFSAIKIAQTRTPGQEFSAKWVLICNDCRPFS